MTAPSSTLDKVIVVARVLFARQGYTATTIKDIAAAAGCSPALIIKLAGSKAELFAAADPSAAMLEEPPGEDEPVGWQIVRRLVDRRDNDEPEPWAMAPIFIRESDNPDATRERTRNRCLAVVASQIGDTSQDQIRAQMVTVELLGLASGMRHLDLLGPGAFDREALIRHYGALVQSIIDSEL